ncbi:ankyrin [Apiospora rasikravindrae]|uniref:Ankyrin n=1 Tax=Apiospora rasikravindrae TaxID=990691 RepID=A0ABR1U8F9_9PEZI
MADPLSIAASIAGLASLAAGAFKTLNDYRAAVRDAPRDVDNLATELRTLSGMLRNLELLASSLQPKGETKVYLHESQITPIAELIRCIDIKLDKAQNDFRATRFKGTFRSLRWPFSASEVEKMVEQLRTYKATIILALSADTLERLKECLKSHEQLQASIMSSPKVIEFLQIMHERVDMTKTRRRTVDCFMKVNPQGYLQTSLRLREENTGEWFIRDSVISRWISTPSSRLWLRGIPGAGKTVLCGSLIAHILPSLQHDAALAFFFCDYKKPDTQSLVNILSSIALQLALQKEEAFTYLQEYFNQLHPENGLPRQAEPKQLIEAIQAMSQVFEKSYIIVDALDECVLDSREVVHGLAELAQTAHRTSIGLFSREDTEISIVLGPHFESFEIEARREDLERYICSQMNLRPALANLQHEDAEEARLIRQQLLSKANGMFRWVSCQLDSLEYLGKLGRKKALESLPPTLNESYDRILQKALLRKRNKLSLEIVRRTLHWLCYDKYGLTIAQLCEALSVSLQYDHLIADGDGLVEEDEVAGYCSSLIRKTEDGERFELAHFTVEEYLYAIDPASSVGAFAFTESEAARTMTLASLRFILQPEFAYDPFLGGKPRRTLSGRFQNHPSHGTPSECFQGHPFYAYASRFWPAQVDVHNDASVRKSLKELLGLKKAANFRSWLIQLFEVVLATCDSSLAKEFERDARQMTGHRHVTHLHVAASLSMPWLCEWLISIGASPAHSNEDEFSALDCALLGPSHIYLYWREMQRGVSFSKLNRIQWLQNTFTGWLTMTTPKNLENTVRVLLQHDLKPTSTTNSFTGLLGVVASFVCQNATIFLLLLEGGPEECLTDNTLEAIKHYFKKGQASPGSALHTIIQAILDLGAFTEDNHVVTRAVELIRDMVIRSGAHWDEFSHIGGKIIPVQIQDQHFTKYLEQAAAQNLTSAVSELLADSRFDNESDVAKNALSVAIACDSFDVVRILLDHIPMTLEEVNGGDLMMWHKAAGSNAVGVLQLFVELGLDTGASLRQVSPEGRTPLTEAIYRKSFKAAELLLSYCDNAPSYFVSDPPAPHLAVQGNSLSTLKTLFSMGMPEIARDSQGATPLHYVHQDCDDELIRYIITHYNQDNQDGNGNVALQTYLP